jgi:hypothetical protein
LCLTDDICRQSFGSRLEFLEDAIRRAKLPEAYESPCACRESVIRCEFQTAQACLRDLLIG